MMHHHTLQRDPNRLVQPTHRMVQSQQRGHPIMLGVPGASPVPPTGVLVTMPVSAMAPPPTASVQQPQHLAPPHLQQPQQQQQQQQSPPQSEVEQQPEKLAPGGPGNATQSSAQPANPLANTKEKTPMCLVNELARYNNIKHQYRLTGEQGPAHKKRFTVTLKLGTEEYEAEGPSIKKAQHAAANEALVLTKFKHPPPKTNRNVRAGSKAGPGGHLTPTVELNALAMKRGEPTVYLVEVSHSPYVGPQVTGYNQYHRNTYPPQNQTRYNNYDVRRNYSTRGHYDNQRYQNYNQYGGGKPHGGWHNVGETYTVTLRVGPREYTGQGPTAQAARHDAAARALQELRQLPLPDNVTEPNTCPVSNALSGIGDDINAELKSPISLVHEISLKRNLNVTFEVLSEKGPPHMKVFVTACKVGDMVTEGEGNGKKISKKRAAEKMLEELRKLPPLSPNVTSIVTRMKRKPAVAKKKTRSLIKVYQEKSEHEVVEDINPISRLIQIQQAKKEKEPVYNLVEERGAPRRREFVMEVVVGQHSATGTGPNKKLAKRAAAEALLSQLRYAPTSVQAMAGSDKSNANDGGDKPRKVTFLEDKGDGNTTQQSCGGTSGRQLVPGLLLVGDQSGTGTFKSGVNLRTTATIAKEFLKAGNSPTADALAKAAHQNKQPSTPVIRPKDQLLYLSQLLGFQVQFSDFPKANHGEFLTLLSLSTDPPQVCHGAGDTTDESHDQAAITALRVLSEMGLDTVAPGKKEMQPNNDGVHNKAGMTKASILSNGLKK